MTNQCPCCSGQLLRHARRNSVYWFCQSCWQEMPDFSSTIIGCRQRVEKLERLVELTPLR